MGDGIKPAGGPGTSEDVGSRPDVGFHDDHVGGHLKAEEAAKKRAALGVMQRRPRRIEVEPEQVGEVRHFRGTQEDPAARDLNRQQRGLVAGRGPARQQAAPRRAGGVPPAVDADVRRIEERVDLLMGTLLELEGLPPTEDHAAAEGEPAVLALVTEAEAAALEAARGLAQAKGPTTEGADPAEPVPEHPRVARDGRRPDGDGQREEGEAPEEGEALQDLAAAGDEARWQRAARDVRFLLQHLIAGGIGVTLAADPEVTFRRLFDGMAAWPSRVPPGRRPQNADDYDAFLAWVFRPEDPTGLMQELQAARADAGGR